MLLMSQRPQRMSGSVMTFTPAVARVSAALGSLRRAVATTVGSGAGLGKAWSRRAAPRVTCR